ncbi:zinc finger protein 488 [Castor canadensis]|jgi:hypothetical protein
MAAGEGVPQSPLAEIRQQLSEPEQSQGCKPVLLEKMSHLGSEAALGRGSREVACAELVVSTVPSKPRPGKPLVQKVCTEQRQSAFTELPQLQVRLGGGQAQDREYKDIESQLGPQKLAPDIPRALTSSTVCSVGPDTTRSEQRSAFSKPTKRLTDRPGCFPIFPTGETGDVLGELSGLLTAADIPCWSRLSSSKLVSDFWNLQMLSQNSLLCTAFQGALMPWPEHNQARVSAPLVPSATTSQALLPPTLSTLGLSTQNWCAKCSLAFHLTADLVFHMRSHHQREHAGPDPHSKKRREEALTCPVCHEYFRERHHLSRHMTSHS